MKQQSIRTALAVMAIGLGAVAATPPTDPEIAAIAVTANTVDIDAGKGAGKKAASKEVRAFAERMVTDHTAVNKSATDLVTKLKVTPKESDASKSLKADGEKAKKRIGKLKGNAFDRAYVDNEVTYHEVVLATIDKTLIPNAQNTELK